MSYLFGILDEVWFCLGAIFNEARLLERKSSVIGRNSLIFVVLSCYIFGSWNEIILEICEDLPIGLLKLSEKLS